jgi:hypothetical protein
MDYDYFISELNTLAVNVERLKRGLEQERDRATAKPSQVEYNRDLLSEPPRVVEPVEDTAPKCNCGLPAEFKKSAPQVARPWAAYFCARPKGDPKNCGFKKWID